MRTRMHVLGVVVAVAAALGIGGRGAMAEDVEKGKATTLSVTGTARVERAPDYVDVWLGVVADELTAGAAQEKASRVSSAAIAAVTALKMAGMEVQTGSVDLTPRYRDPRGNELAPQIVAYSANIMLRVRMTETGGVARVIDAAIGAGCNRVESVQFGIKDALSAREEATRLALKAAKRKGAVMAEALELKLGRVVEATTTPRHSSPWSRWSSSNISQVSSGEQGGEPEDGQNGVVPGKVEVWVDATVVFEAGV